MDGFDTPHPVAAGTCPFNYLPPSPSTTSHPATPSTSLPDVADKACTSCANFAAAVTELHNSEQHYDRDAFIVKGTSSYQIGTRWLVSLTVAEEPYVIRDGKGNSVDRGEAGNIVYQPDVKWDDGKWEVIAIRASRR